jgi:hypothetical protein
VCSNQFRKRGLVPPFNGATVCLITGCSSIRKIVAHVPLFPEYLLLLFAFFATVTNADEPLVLTVPKQVESTFGDSGVDPYILHTSVQFVYGAAEFANQGAAQIMITGISFRADDSSTSSLNVTIPDFTIRVGVYSGSLSDIRANTGYVYLEGGTTVFSQKTLHITSPLGLTFGVRFDFETPFLYDRSNGNLVVELRSGGFATGSGLWGFDAATSSDGRFIYIEDTFGHTGALNRLPATQFTYFAVPEPSAGCLFGVLGAFLVVLRRLL